MQAQAVAPRRDPAPIPPVAVCFRPGRVITVLFTGVAPRCKSRWRTLFNPPLDGALATIIDDLGRSPLQVMVAHAKPAKEPESLRRAIVVLSAGEDEGRHPLAYLTTEGGTLTLEETEAALALVRRRWVR